MKKHFFVSTAIDYVNAPAHCGHVLEKIQADVIARYHRLLGENTFFLTGTDENSLKNVQAAREEKIPVKKLVDRNAKKFYELKKVLNLSFDDFIRTTEKRHLKGARKLWEVCQKDIYKKPYQGLYCVGCEEFYKENELVNGLCPEHQTKPELVEEENYFFRLSKYQKKLKEIIKTDEIKIIPQTRKNEVASFINTGLEDICISRSMKRARGWGISVPGDSSQIIWVWFDALSNYINALGYAENSKQFQEWWQKNKNKLHIIGKGILRFHGIYWLAILLSAKISLPNTIFVHGHLISGGQKMSKSLGNVIDPFEIVKKYGTDAVRYFFLREIHPTEDSDFTYEKFEARYNSDLVNGLGNLVARILGMAEKYCHNTIPKINKNPSAHFLRTNKKIHNSKKTWDDINRYLTNFQFNRALFSIWKFIREIDKYIEKTKPWNLAKERKIKELNCILYGLLDALSQIAWQIYVFMPATSLEIAKSLNLKNLLEKNPNYKKSQETIKQGAKIKKIKTLFLRLK